MPTIKEKIVVLATKEQKEKIRRLAEKSNRNMSNYIMTELLKIIEDNPHS